MVTASSGTALDDLGNPVPGARACLLSEGREILCVDTDDNGYYALPDAAASTVRLNKRGHLPATVAAVAQESPIVLARAASLRVRIVDAATKDPVGGGHVVVSFPSGRVIRDLPFTKGGMHLATIPAGAAKVRAELPGFRSDVVDVLLEGGHQSEVEVPVRKER